MGCVWGVQEQWASRTGVSGRTLGLDTKPLCRFASVQYLCPKPSLCTSRWLTPKQHLPGLRWVQRLSRPWHRRLTGVCSGGLHLRFQILLGCGRAGHCCPASPTHSCLCGELWAPETRSQGPEGKWCLFPRLTPVPERDEWNGQVPCCVGH